MNPGLSLLTDWIITSGNTALSVDLLVSYLERIDRYDIVEIVHKGQGYRIVLHSSISILNYLHALVNKLLVAFENWSVNIKEEIFEFCRVTVYKVFASFVFDI